VKDAHRFRGICIEGTVSLDVALDLLEWMPKVGLNSYFMQFMEGYEFFERYYSGEKNNTRTATDFNLAVCRGIVKKIVHKAKELGLMYHGVGHGFTCECYGVPGFGWDKMPDSWPKEHLDELALIENKRAFRWDVPLLTALCYSNKNVQKRVTEWAAEYIKEHSEFDYVHFWLDDGHQNKCECENCRDVRISDWYIKLLNELDERLTAKGVSTKVVFLVYHETLWAPEREVLKNPGRYTFMFAPIQRSFGEVLGDVDDAPEPKPYTLNNQPLPKSNLEMISFLKPWNEYRKKIGMDMSDSFDFDYYFNRFDDPGQFKASRIVYDDIAVLRKNGLNGIINCQSQRLFAHAALPINVYAAALLQPDRAFGDIVNEFFCGAFGKKNANIFRRYFEMLTEKSLYLRNRGKDGGSLEELNEILDAPLPDYELDCLGIAESVRLLRFTRSLYIQICKSVSVSRAGDKTKSDEVWRETKRYGAEKEKEFETAFENYYFWAPK
jgi:hypothetical protein